MRATAALVAIAAVACTAAPVERPAKPAAARAAPRAAAVPRDLSYALSWNGQLVGAATERFGRHGDGYRLRRQERVRVRRGATVVELGVDIEIVTGADLVARSVVVRHRDQDGVRTDRARRDGQRWRIEVAGEPTRFAPGEAVPAELVPHRHGRAFRGPVLLSGLAFAEASLTVEPIGPHRSRARLTAAGVTIDSVIELGDDGARERVTTTGPLAARRVATAPALPASPPDVIASTAIPIASAPASHLLRLVGIDRLPPSSELPGQRITAAAGAWTVAFPPAPGLSPSRARELRTLVAIVASRLTGDLGHSPRSGADALALERGDCNAYALLFAELAARRGLEARVVTGFRRERDRLLRHRWAMVRIDQRWVAIDPTFGEVPARRGALLALVAHGTRAADLALANLAYAGTGDVRAE